MKVVVVGGAGNVGRLFATHLGALGAEVVRVDAAGGDGVERVDVLKDGAAAGRAVRGAEVVVNCLPDSIAERWAPQLASSMGEGALLVDTLSVKSPYLAALAPGRFECLSLNPLFAPDLGFAGRAVLAVRVRGGEQSARFLGLVESWGARVIELEQSEHDAAMAVMQAAVHASVLAFGLLLERLPPRLRDGRAGTPPFQTMLMLLARVAGNDPGVYWDIQRANPFAGQGRQGLADSLRALEACVGGDDVAGFGALFARINASLGDAAPDLRRRCADFFASLSETS